MPTPSAAPPRNILCYILSDIHLRVPIGYETRTRNNNVDENSFDKEHHMLAFLERLADEMNDDQDLLLILNGDIFDINGSWFQSPVPWDEQRTKTVEAHLHSVVQNIVDANHAIIEAWARLLTHPNTRLVYIIGNHDYLLGTYPSGQERIIKALETITPRDAHIRQKVMFTHTYQHPQLKLYAEHGHVLDPFNYISQPGIPPLGEVINVSVINQLPVNLAHTLNQQGYSQSNIRNITHRLEQMEFLRPLTLFPLWIRLMATRFSQDSPKLPKAHDIELLIQQTILATVQDQQVLDMMANKLHLPGWLLRNTARLAIRFPWALHATSYILSKFIQHEKANTDQYQKALRLYHEHGYQLIAFGHTHKPSAKPIGEHGYYFNTGSWTPVIQLSRKPDNPKTLIDLEETFRRIEHSGVVRITKDFTQPGEPVDYALQTIRSGSMKTG